MLKRIVVGLLLVLIAVLFLGFRWLRAADGVYVIGQTIPELAGYSADGTYVQPPEGRCVLLRLTADRCPYCKQDQPQYARLVDEARRSNCFVVVLGPRVGDIAMDSGGGVRSLQFVTLDVGRRLVPFLTPQTLVIDAAHRLAWQRRGALADQDVVAAAKALQRMR